MTDIHTTDDDLDALMAELDLQSAEIMAAASKEKANAPTPTATAPSDDDLDDLLEPDAVEAAPKVAETEQPAAAAPMSFAEKIREEARRKAAALEADGPDEDALAKAKEEAAAKAEAEAQAKAKAQAEAEAKAQAEAKAKAEAEAAETARLKAELEAKAKAQAEAKEKAELAAAKEEARLKAELEAARADAQEEAKRAAAAPAPSTAKAAVARPTEDTPAGQSPLRHSIDVSQFQSDTRVSEATLDKCMMEQASLRAFYGTQAAQAEAQASRMKARFEVIEATIYDQHRKALVKSEEKVTEKMVETAVKQDARWLKAKNMMIEAETIAAMNKSLVDSLRDRKDMLVQLGADRREGMKGQLRMSADQDERAALADRAANAAKNALAGVLQKAA